MLVKVIKDSVIHRGEVIRTGKTFTCDDSIGESLIERNLVERIYDAEVVEDAVAPVKPFEGMETGHLDPNDLAENYSYQELKKLASDLGVSAKGSKEELIERISAVEVGYEAEAVVEEEEEAEELPNTDMPE